MASTWDQLDEATRALFEGTYPGAGQEIWQQQDLANNPPPAAPDSGPPPAPSSGWASLDPETQALFEGTYPGAGQQVWTQQNAANNMPPPAPGTALLPPAAPGPGQVRTTAVQPTVTGPVAPVVTQGRVVTTQTAAGQGPGSTQAGGNWWESDWGRQYLEDQRKLAEAQARARQFQQGIEQGKLDLQKAMAEADAAYKQSMLQFQDRQLAQQAAEAAMRNSIAMQTLALQQMQARAARARARPFARVRVV